MIIESHMEKQNPESQTRCQYLPEYIMVEIRLRLPAKSVARFRCVSKTWLSICTDISFLRAHSHRASTKALVIQNALRRWGLDPAVPARFTSADGFSSGCNAVVRSTLSLPALPPIFVELLTSRDGLILVSTYGLSYFVANPVNGQCTRLPVPLFNKDCPRKTFGFYFHRWTGEYRLLSVVHSPKRFPFKSEVLSLGAKSWRTLKASPPVKYVFLRHSPVCADDFLHWISYKASRSEHPVILVFDIKAELFTVMTPPPYQEEWEVMLDKEKRLVGIGLVDIESRLGFYAAGRDKNCRDDLRIDVWLVEDYKIKTWTKFYSVSCNQVCCLLDLVHKWQISALHLKNGELLLLFDSLHETFLVRCNMKSSKYCTERAIKVEMSTCFPTLIYMESLISCKSFCDRDETKLSDLLKPAINVIQQAPMFLTEQITTETKKSGIGPFFKKNMRFFTDILW